MISGGAAPKSAPVMICPQLNTSPLISVVMMPTGSTSWPVEGGNTSGYRNCAHDTVKAKMVAAIRPGRATGMKMRVSVWNQEAPSMIAASSSSFGMEAKYPIMIQVQNGTVSVG